MNRKLRISGGSGRPGGAVLHLQTFYTNLKQKYPFLQQHGGKLQQLWLLWGLIRKIIANLAKLDLIKRSDVIILAVFMANNM